jgi:hypothetical protein
MDPKPDIGHADAEHHPDMVAHRWEDSRLKEQTACNNTRFIEAAEKLYNKFSSYTKDVMKRPVHINWEDLRSLFFQVTSKTSSGPFNHHADERQIEYQAQASWLGSYNEKEWLEEAVITIVHGLPDKKPGALFTLFDDESFWREDVEIEATHWFRFQESVKAHQKRAMQLLQPRFDTMGIDLGDN